MFSRDWSSDVCSSDLLRHQLSYVRRREPFQMMAEETVALAVRGRANPQWLADDSVNRLLECTPTGNLPAEAVQREVRAALDFLRSEERREGNACTTRV